MLSTALWADHDLPPVSYRLHLSRLRGTSTWATVTLSQRHLSRIGGSTSGHHNDVLRVGRCCWGVRTSSRRSTSSCDARGPDAAPRSCCAATPGIGKTALLGYAQSRAEGMTVLRSVGIEAEHELPFAGLHQLVRPCLGLVARLPLPQRTALRARSV